MLTQEEPLWKINSSAFNSLEATNKFYLWLPKDSSVKLFIDNHCLHLLKSDLGFLGKENWSLVSIDTKYNNKVRFHENPNAAKVELSALVNITNLKPSINFTPPPGGIIFQVQHEMVLN